MRICMRLMTRRSNQVMYAMPVSSAKMMTSARTTSIKISDTRGGHLLAPGQNLGVGRMLVGHQRPNHLQALRGRAASKSLGEAGDNAPIRARVRERRRATLLMLDSTFEIGQ